MGHLNTSQLRVMTTLLSRSSTSRIIILAGLHTGRHVIRTFLDTCIEVGLEIERAEEIDRRNEIEEKGIDWKKVVEEKWSEESIVEGIEEERRRWLVWIILRWPEDIRAYETRVGRV